MVLGTMKGLYGFLEFTTETEEDFADSWLPTLDTKLRVMPNNQVDYCFYEKPTTSPVTVRKESALEENSKVQILSNNLIRMYYNTREESSTEVKTKIIDDYARKLLTSGYKLDQIRRIVLGGIRGYEGKLRRSRELGRKSLHKSAKESQGARHRGKLLGKSTWFKGRRKNKGEGVTVKEGLGEGGSLPSLKGRRRNWAWR